MTAPLDTALSPHYYRDNFLRLCATVSAQYGDMLDGEEEALLARFAALGFDAQCLYVRLVSRRGPWFRASRLSYPELGDLTATLDELQRRELLLVADELGAPELGALYTRAELQRAFEDELAAAAEFDPGAGKQALLDAIAGLAPGPLLPRLAAIDPLRVVGPALADAVARLQILFFGNRRQGLTEFVLQDLGVARYYPYRLERSQRLFANRAAFDEFLHCAALADAYSELRDSGDAAGLAELAAAVLATQVTFESSAPRFDRLCNNLGRDLERLAQPQLALALYRRSNRHPARERRARILERCGASAEALRLCADIRREPWCEAEAEAAARIAPRLERALHGKTGRRTRDRFDSAELTLAASGEPVELVAARALQRHWQAVHYVENRLFNTLFGLAFWEQIFLPLPGAFHNPFQSVPADMYDGDFLPRRRPALERRLQELATADLPAVLNRAHARYRDYQCRWVDWRAIDADLVDSAARVIPAAHLLAIWRRLLFDPRENRCGFPDLVAFGDTPGNYRLVEVKGPGDTLQDSQKRWLRFFAAQGIPAGVVKVAWERRND